MSDFGEIFPPDFSEDDLAEEFVHRFGDVVRFNPTRNDWWRWDGVRWRAGSRSWVLGRIREICREKASDLNRNQRLLRLGRRIASNGTMVAVERMASRDAAVVEFDDLFDASPLLLNTPAGRVDLKTGDSSAHDPNDFLSKLTGTAAAVPGTPAPLWEHCLDLWMDGDRERIAYLQRIAGYCLSGETRERAIFILHGANTEGPGVFLEMMRTIFGDYAIKVPMETFLWTPYQRHPAELTQLRGKRLAVAVEANKDSRWHTSRLMEIATGGPLTARYMYGDFFEFQSTAKLMLQAVHLPPIETAADEARSIFRLVPFPEAAYFDRGYLEPLRHEAPAILRWAIDGYRGYLEYGLTPPPAAVAATNQYLEFSDPVKAWIGESCTEAYDAFSPSETLYKSWRKWCVRSGESEVRSQRWLSLRLKEHGFRHEQNRRPRGFYGLKPRNEKGA